MLIRKPGEYGYKHRPTILTSPGGIQFVLSSRMIQFGKSWTARRPNGKEICSGVADRPANQAEKIKFVSYVKDMVDLTVFG